ncbi:MAG: DUF4465 domain-containing protein [Flavobacteriales bacterium]
MKKNYIILFFTILLGYSGQSQTYTGFEDLSLQVDSFWNGSDLSGSFVSGWLKFENKYDTAWGGSWKGFSYSTMRDTTTSTFSNQYSCIAGSGSGGSKTYGVGFASSTYFPTFDPAFIALNRSSVFNGIWVNNSTYAYHSMKNGDAFAKKFGDSTNASGAIDSTDGKDWFKLTIFGGTDSVEFYLADFRGPDSTDYIIKDWTYVDLSGMNSAISLNLKFKLTSSDNGIYGMNTPGYFCIDSISYSPPSIIDEHRKINLSVYPNPTSNVTKVYFGNELQSGKYKLLDMSGREIVNTIFNSSSQVEFDLTSLNSGAYLAIFEINNQILTKKIIKQ